MPKQKGTARKRDLKLRRAKAKRRTRERRADHRCWDCARGTRMGGQAGIFHQSDCNWFRKRVVDDDAKRCHRFIKREEDNNAEGKG